MMKYFAASLPILLASTVAFGETVTFWDSDLVVSVGGKYHGGLNFKQDSVYVEYVAEKDGQLTGGSEVHMNHIDGEQCELMHRSDEGLLIVPKIGPRAKLVSMKYRFKDRYREGGTANSGGSGEPSTDFDVGGTVKLYLWVGNRDSLEPTSMPGEAGWITYELKRNRTFEKFDFQSQSTPPPRGKRYYITTDARGSIFIDDIEVGR